MIRIFTDTSSNLTPDLLKEYNLGLLPFSYSINGVQKSGDDDFNGKEFYDAMRSGVEVKTSMINISNFMEPIRKVLENGDDVIYIGMSGGISGTAHCASVAVLELKEEFPERKITAIDTLAASLGEGLLVLDAAIMLKNGCSFEQIEESILQKRRNMCQFFTVDDLEYLKRGGRLSRVATVIGTVLKIKPILTGDSEGKIVLCSKARGRRQALGILVDYYKRLSISNDQKIGIAHADSPDDAQELLNMLKQAGFIGDCITVCYEPVTGAHVGPGTVALFFMGTSKH